jgi:hypothetical protein
MRERMMSLLSCARRLSRRSSSFTQAADEDADEIVARLLAQLLRALPVDVEQHVAAGTQRLLHRPRGVP